MNNNIHLKIDPIIDVSHEIIKNMVLKAIEEDIQSLDITSYLIDINQKSKAYVFTREPMILCGSQWVNEVFKNIDPEVKIFWNYSDGDSILINKILFKVIGKTRSILSSERIALNYLQILSSVSTKTRQYVELIANTNCKILDTRKTIPGFRIAQKYAVFCGGGMNHRIGLFDAILIKDNHIVNFNSIKTIINNARNIFPNKLIECEVENFHQLKIVLDAGIDVIMLDNFSIKDIKKAVKIVNKKAQIEVSGDINLQNINDVANTGIDFISIGDLTKHIKSIDLSMKIEKNFI